MRKFDAIQPICDDCYQSKYSSQVAITSIIVIDPERCCECGQPTRGGVYVRIDPNAVRFPTLMIER
jgi:hypothetical protein